jgi:tetratricopeptide (TPR) repeat protein
VKLVSVFFAASALVCAYAAAPQENHSHPPPEKLGTVSFPTSCAPSVAHEFERSVALLHSFAYQAAEQAFREVAVSDPTCAMAHWGIAMSLYHQLWSPPSAAELRDGQAEIERAQHLSATTREKQFIAAAAAYYGDSDHVSPPVRAKAYEAAMAEVARSNPKDTEAQVFYALALIATASPEDGSHAAQKRAVSILEPIYEAQPDHPGVAHYLIHANDSTELAPRGLAAARAYSKIAPSAPHALHMPSHIFTRLGLWDDSIASNQAARAAAHAQGDTGEELHAMDYLTYAYLQRGRVGDAEQVVASLRSMSALLGSDFKAGYAATAMPVRLAVETRAWSDAAALQALTGSPPHVAAMVFWAHAVADSRTGHPQAADSDIAKIEDCRQKLASSGDTYWATQVDVLDKEAKAWQSAASANPTEAVRLLRLAADEEDAVEKSPATPGPIVPAREQLGELLLQLNRPKQALSEYQAALVAAPGRRAGLTGAAKAAELVGDTKTAAQMRAKLEGKT